MFNMFKFFKKSSLLIKRSQGIANTFTKTLQDLRSINEEIIKEDTELIKRQEAIQAERNQLALIKSSNEKMATKIEEFLN